MAEIYENRVNESKIDTVLADDILFDGDLTFENELMIKGQYSGKITSRGTLYIAENADVKADIEIDSIYIRGRVEGDIEAESRVELRGKAVVIGKITAPNILMDEDCQFDGVSCVRPSKKGKQGKQ